MYGDTNAMLHRDVFQAVGGFPEDFGYALEVSSDALGYRSRCFTSLEYAMVSDFRRHALRLP